MLTPRRSFIKFLGAALGSLALPSIVKTAVSSFAPEAEKVEDMEEIFQGLVTRFKTIRLSTEDGILIASFLRRFKTKTGEELLASADECQEITERYGSRSPQIAKFRRERLDQVIRFWCDVVQYEGPSNAIRNENVTTTKKSIVPEVIRATTPLIDALKERGAFKEFIDRRSPNTATKA